jgi:hypothetical protein
MIILLQGNVNKISVTLTEKKQSSTTIYLFEFINQESRNKLYTVAPDLSTSPNRYNQFCITETTGLSGTTNPLNAQVFLTLAGFYYYNVYENPNSVLSPAGLNQVETGKALVIAPASAPTPTYVSSVNPTLIVYKQ